MKAALVAVASCLAAALIAVAVVTHSALSRQDQQLSQDSRQISQLQSRMVNVAASVDGSRRDLITCEDLEQMSWQLSGTDSIGGSISGVAGPAPISLPAHCINQ